ncbi:MAG: ABC transporter ATP-binding protein [Actinobacteria bacterium]|nr:ABC transporter ATP-binding protein [Actinomycetota bacterium]
MRPIAVEGLHRRFPGRPPTTALDGIDLDVAAGSLVAVLGPSGCGKTTLLRLVAGLDRPDAGTIRIGDELVEGPGHHVAPHRRGVGLVPQQGALFPHLDVAGNVAFGLHRRPRPDRARRVDDLLALVGLAGAGSRRPDQLSGGQQQRVALARALAPEPSVVLLDEPFSALDTGLRASLRAEVAQLLRDAGMTAMLVTHDQVEALTMADRVAVVRDGRVVQVGAPDELYRRPVDGWVGTFLGDAVRVPGRRTGDRTATGPLGDVELADGFAHHDGPEVMLFVRPEQLRPDEPGEDPTVPAVVVGTRFQGPDTLVELALDAGATVTARWSSTTGARLGDRVDLAVHGPVLAHRPAAPSDDD